MACHTLTSSHDAQGAFRRWYVDGHRVPFGTFYALDQRAARQDSFATERRGDRYLHSKVVTIGRHN